MTERNSGEPPRGERVNEMEEGVFYDLDPPSVIQGKTFKRVQCEYRVPDRPNEYVVRGIPEGGNQMESFVLRFTERGIRVTRSQQQEASTNNHTTRPPLKLVD